MQFIQFSVALLLLLSSVVMAQPGVTEPVPILTSGAPWDKPGWKPCSIPIICSNEQLQDARNYAAVMRARARREERLAEFRAQPDQRDAQVMRHVWKTFESHTFIQSESKRLLQDGSLTDMPIEQWLRFGNYQIVVPSMAEESLGKEFNVRKLQQICALPLVKTHIYREPLALNVRYRAPVIQPNGNVVLREVAYLQVSFTNCNFYAPSAPKYEIGSLTEEDARQFFNALIE